MKSIAFVIDTIESPNAGTEKQLLYLIKGLKRKGWRPHLCALRGSHWLESEFKLCPLFVADIRSFKKADGLFGIVRLARYFRENRINIVQTQFRDSNIAGIIAARLSGTGPAVVSARRNQGYWIKSRGEYLLLKIFNRGVDLFVANSESTRAWVVENEAVAREKVKVIYNGVDLGAFEGAPGMRQAMRESLGIDAGAKAVGIVANLRPVKAVDLFLKAASTVKKMFPQAVFLITGDGPERESLVEICKREGLDGSARFLGSRDDIPGLLSAFDAGVLCSHSESFSNSVVEYMAAGVPVVCTDVGGLKEIVEDGVNGFVVAPGSPEALAAGILKALQCPPGVFFDRNRKKAKEGFSMAAMVAAHERAYLRISAKDHGNPESRAAVI